MSGKRKVKSVTTDIRWRDLVRKYRYNWGEAIVLLFGMIPTWQQEADNQLSTGHGEPYYRYVRTRYR